MSLSIEALCQCAICCEIMTDPKTLQCEHSFCKECLEECVEFDDNSVLPFITCPICRVKNNLGVGGTVSALNAQLFLRQCFDQLNLNDTSERQVCIHCKNAIQNALLSYLNVFWIFFVVSKATLVSHEQNLMKMILGVFLCPSQDTIFLLYCSLLPWPYNILMRYGARLPPNYRLF